MAKRRLFLRDPQLDTVQRILFVKRHPFEPSHNYSDLFDSAGGPGGGICVLDIPRVDGRLEPGQARVTTLFNSGKGIARDPIAGFDARTIYFGYRPSKDDYYHLLAMNADGGQVRQMTDGAFTISTHVPCRTAGWHSSVRAARHVSCAGVRRRSSCFAWMPTGGTSRRCRTQTSANGRRR